jgi:hypothetical protein
MHWLAIDVTLALRNGVQCSVRVTVALHRRMHAEALDDPSTGS